MPGTSWYETSWFGSIVGALITVIVTILVFIFNNKNQQRQEWKSFLLLIINNHNKLFTYLVQCKLNNYSNINYLQLRELIEENANILFILPKNIKESFTLLFKIYFNGPEYYNENKTNIQQHIRDIITTLDKYGVDVFGD